MVERWFSFFWWPIFRGCVSFRVGNLYYSALSKKSPTRPTERTPNPEYLITLATSGSVGKVTFNFGFQQDPTYHEPYLLVGSDQSTMPKGLNLICCNISLQWHKVWCTWFRTSTKQWGCKTGVLFMAIAGMIFHLSVIIWHKLTYKAKTSPYNSEALYIEFRFYASTTPLKNDTVVPLQNVFWSVRSKCSAISHWLVWNCIWASWLLVSDVLSSFVFWPLFQLICPF